MQYSSHPLAARAAMISLCPFTELAIHLKAMQPCARLRLSVYDRFGTVMVLNSRMPLSGAGSRKIAVPISPLDFFSASIDDFGVWLNCPQPQGPDVLIETTPWVCAAEPGVELRAASLVRRLPSL